MITSHSLGHQRWQDIFGFAPPLVSLAERIHGLKTVVDPLGKVNSKAVMVCMLAFKIEDAQGVMALGAQFSWFTGIEVQILTQKALVDFDIAHISNHAVLSRVVRVCFFFCLFPNIYIHISSHFF